MKLVINLEKDNVEELRKAVELLQKVICNKENGEYYLQGLEKFNVDNPRAHPERLPPQAQKMLEQEKMMKDIDISKVLERKYKKRLF